MKNTHSEQACTSVTSIHSHYACACKHATFFCTGSGQAAYVECRLLNRPTIRHSQCEIAVAKEDARCLQCSSYRRCLNIMLTSLKHRSEMDNENRTAPNSRVNYCHLSTPEKNQRMCRLHSSLRAANRRITRLQARLDEATATAGEVLDEQTHGDLRDIMHEHYPSILDNYPPDSFGRIFWLQQMDAAKAKSASSMRWHPLMIKWCLHIRHYSSSAYEVTTHMASTIGSGSSSHIVHAKIYVRRCLYTACTCV